MKKTVAYLSLLAVLIGTAVYAQPLPNWLEKQVRSGSLTRQEAMLLNQPSSRKHSNPSAAPAPTVAPTPVQEKSPPVASRESAQPSLTAEDYYRLGTKARSQNNYPGALVDLTRAIRLKPTYAEAYSERAGALMDIGNYQEAVKDCTQAIKLNPRYARAYFRCGVSYNHLGNVPAAMKNLSESIRLDSKFGYAYLRRGELESNQGNYTDAVADLTQAIKSSPDDTCTFCSYFKRGYAYLKLSEYQKAEADFSEALRSDGVKSELPDVYEDRGWVRHKLGNIAGARQDYQQAIDLYRSQGRMEEYQKLLDKLNRMSSSIS
jgi:tetratricopeptide (TPR) repeat protein